MKKIKNRCWMCGEIIQDGKIFCPDCAEIMAYYDLLDEEAEQIRVIQEETEHIAEQNYRRLMRKKRVQEAMAAELKIKVEEMYE